MRMMTKTSILTRQAATRRTHRQFASCQDGTAVVFRYVAPLCVRYEVAEMNIRGGRWSKMYFVSSLHKSETHHGLSESPCD